MITIKKTIEITYYLKESTLEAFANHNGYDVNELNEAIDNNELGVEWICNSLNETIIDYKVERS